MKRLTEFDMNSKAFLQAWLEPLVLVRMVLQEKQLSMGFGIEVTSKVGQRIKIDAVLSVMRKLLTYPTSLFKSRNVLTYYLCSFRSRTCQRDPFKLEQLSSWEEED